MSAPGTAAKWTPYLLSLLRARVAGQRPFRQLRGFLSVRQKQDLKKQCRGLDKALHGGFV